MNRRPTDGEDPDRLYVITGGRSRADDCPLDLVTLIVAESAPSPGMQSEHVKILRMCRSPMAVVEIAANLGLPVTVVKILLSDLLDTGHITPRHPTSATSPTPLPTPGLLKQVLVGLQQL